MLPGQTLFQSTSRILAGLEPVLAAERPGMVIVQGDTTTTFCGALAAFYLHIPVAHVEAGLRTGDLRQPFPEEMNRVLTSHLANLHFAATEKAAENLRREGVAPCSITVTGNTGIDAVLYVRDGLAQGTLRGRDWTELDASKKLIVVTAHRRESFGRDSSASAARWPRSRIAPDVQMVYPVHPNPNVQGPVQRYLAGHPNIRLIEPLSYVPFVDLMRRAYLLITDSGGIQEEGPSLGQADPGVAGEDRAAGGGAGRHGEAGGHRGSHDRERGQALDRGSRRIRRDGARSQSLRGWKGQPPHSRSNSFILKRKIRIKTCGEAASRLAERASSAIEGPY